MVDRHSQALSTSARANPQDKEDNTGGLQRCDRMQTPYTTEFEKQACVANACSGFAQEVQ